MTQFLILLAFIIISFSSFAQDFDSEPDSKTGIYYDNIKALQNNKDKKELQENNTTGLEIDSKGKKVGSTTEWNYTYLRFAQSNISFSEKEKGSSLAFGHRQVADSFYYDLQYNMLSTNSSKSKAQALLLGLGWQASWNHRLLPYVGVQVGYSSLKSDTLDVSGSGMYTGIDAGVILKRYYPFLFMVGTRFGVHNFSNEKIQNMTVQEGYFAVGIEVF